MTKDELRAALEDSLRQLRGRLRSLDESTRPLGELEIYEYDALSRAIKKGEKLLEENA